jgi:hypothetical protein
MLQVVRRLALMPTSLGARAWAGSCCLAGSISHGVPLVNYSSFLLAIMCEACCVSALRNCGELLLPATSWEEGARPATDALAPPR